MFPKNQIELLLVVKLWQAYSKDCLNSEFICSETSWKIMVGIFALSYLEMFIASYWETCVWGWSEGSGLVINTYPHVITEMGKLRESWVTNLISRS